MKLPLIVRSGIVLFTAGIYAATVLDCTAAVRPAMDRSLRAEISRAVVSRNGLYAFDKALNQLVALRGPDAALLRHDADDSIALRSAWDPTDEQLVLGLFKKSVSHEVAHERVTRFLGFFEGRVGTTPPSWWTPSLEYDAGDVTQTAAHSPATRLPTTSFSVPWWGAKVGRIYYAGASPTVISQVDREIKISQAGKQVRLSSAVLKSMVADRPFDYAPQVAMLYPVLTGNDCFILSYFARQPDAIRVTRIRVSDGRVLWRAYGWGNGGRSYVGTASQSAVLVLSESSATVFGESTFGTFAESFSLRTGKARYRFSSTAYTPSTATFRDK